MFLKKFTAAIFAVLFAFSVCSFVFAQEYRIDGLNCTFTLPDTWQVATRSSFDEDFVSSRFKTEASQWSSFMERKDLYLFAALPDDVDGQHEITIKAYETDEPMDYRDRYMFELKLTAKASNDNNPNPTIVYMSYDALEGAETKFLVFDYKDTDDSGNPVYGRFYHTVVNGYTVEFDMNAYEPLSDEYISMFNSAVLNTKIDGKQTDSSARTKQNLIYLALCVLAIAFVTVIIIFIVSKVKEKKQFNQAAEEVRRAAVAEQRTVLDNEDEELEEIDELSDNDDLLQDDADDEEADFLEDK